FAKGPDPARPVILTSFVTVCFAEISHNAKHILTDLTAFLRVHMKDLLQEISTSLGHPLDLEVILEIQPTHYRTQRVHGWSLTVMIIGSGQEHHAVRGLWGWGIQALMDALKAYAPIEG
ncbi:MAG: hypothetical protein AB7P17_12145, partial [Nitrospirales bacterium]